MIPKHVRNLAAALVGGMAMAGGLLGGLVYMVTRPPSRASTEILWNTCKLTPHDDQFREFSIACRRANGSTDKLSEAEKREALERPEIQQDYLRQTRKAGRD